MKQLRNKIKIGNEGENKIVDFIMNLIDGTLEGDNNNYKEGEIVQYKYSLVADEYVKEQLSEMGLTGVEVKNFLGRSGKCLIDGDDENLYYNVREVYTDLVVWYEWVELV